MFGKRNRTRALEAVANAPVGAAVRIGGDQATIIGTCVFDEAGDRWVEHLIGFGDGRRLWLSIEDFDEVVATLWQTVDLRAVDGGPDDARIRHQGATYERSESGTAAVTAKGGTGLPDQGAVRYADFTGPDGTRISFERFGAEGAGRRSIATAGSCPNCGAGLAVDKHGRCSHCGAAAEVDHGRWDEWETALGRDVTDRTTPA